MSKKPSSSTSKRIQKPQKSVEDLLASIPSFESSLLSPTYNPNPLLPLLALIRHVDAQVVHKAIWSSYRVFVKFISEGRMGGREDEEVGKWVEERFGEFRDVLGGLLRDSEGSLRTSAITILLNLLPPLSVSLSNILSHPLIHLPHLRHTLSYFILPRSSLRGAVKGSPVNSSQWTGEEELPSDVRDVLEKHLVENDDLRWAFFRELSALLVPYTVEGCPIPSQIPEITLALLSPLENLPKKQADINTFFLFHLSFKPPQSGKPGKSQPAPKVKKSKKEKDEKKSTRPEWMAHYDTSESEEEEGEGAVAAGSKRKRNAGKQQGEEGKKGKGGMWGEVWNVDSHRKGFTDCWLGLLSLPLSDSQTRQILLNLHSTIFPNLTPGRVIRMTDWLGSLCDKGGVGGLLSLNGLFLLIKDYGLEYPQFYKKLYALMDREVMHVKYRARFFRLTEMFLSSTHLPATLIASFIKRLSHLSLSAPPSATIMIIPFIYNLLRRHPSCLPLLSRTNPDFLPISTSPFSTTPLPSRDYVDPFNPLEEDPLKTGALESSCWELESLRSHYVSSVGVLGKVFEEELTKPAFGMEDFLDHGYGTMFDTELKRKIKSAPALAMEPVQNPFPTTKTVNSGAEAGEEVIELPMDVVAELWTFGA